VGGDLQDARLVTLIGCNTAPTCAEKGVTSGIHVTQFESKAGGILQH
jgi:hypothetical protein